MSKKNVESANRLSVKKVQQIFEVEGNELSSVWNKYIQEGIVPGPHKEKKGPFTYEYYLNDDLSEIGKKIGFLKDWKSPSTLAVFTTKGGVLKTTVTLNIAKVLALHGLKVLVIGLDMQGDITRALGHQVFQDEDQPLDTLIKAAMQEKGLYDYFTGRADLNEIIVSLSKNIDLIPETPELAALNDHLFNANRREYWLKEKVIEKLKTSYDCILMDCSPNWNRLATNALVACDVLISPLECKINNFRNFKVFERFLTEFKQEMSLHFEQIFIPTLYSMQKKLSMDIKNWYVENVQGCLEVGIRESTISEEASALNLSVLEHAPKEALSNDLKKILMNIQNKIIKALNDGNNSVGNNLDFSQKKPQSGAQISSNLVH